MRRGNKSPAWALVCGLALLGCTSARERWLKSGVEGETPEGQKGAQAVKKDPPAQAPFDARAFVAQQRTPLQCEASARRLQARSRDDAWNALKACVEGMQFTPLQALLGPAWAQDLQERPEAATMLARVIAYRGGSVEGDLRLLQDKHIPIFGLEAAMTQPETYKGRYVLFRARVGDSRKDGQQSTVWLVEQSLGSVATERREGAAVEEDSAETLSGDVSGQTQSLGAGNLGGSVSRSERHRSSVTLPNYDNITVETGREALGRMAAPDPFLAPGRDFIILGRFDGMRTLSGGDEDADEAQLPVFSIVGYYAPQQLVIY